MICKIVQKVKMQEWNREKHTKLCLVSLLLLLFLRSVLLVTLPASVTVCPPNSAELAGTDEFGGDRQRRMAKDGGGGDQWSDR